MKKILFLAIVTILASCQQKKIDQMQAIQDSIMHVGIEKDSAIINFVATMTEIQENLDSIKQIEELVKMESNSGLEMQRNAKDQIVSDISVIHELLQKNKDLVAKLEKQLGASNVKVAEFQKAIALLNRQIEQKDIEITNLQSELEILNVDIAGLNERINIITDENVQKDLDIEMKNKTIEGQTIDINTAFYAFGTKKELADNGVAEKQGGVLGIGRTLKMKENFNAEYFTMVDIRDLTNLDLFVKKAELVTIHPDGSYHFEGDNTIESLVIDNPQDFWSTSKYLIIAVD